MSSLILRGPQIGYICNKLNAYDLYAPTWWGVLDIVDIFIVLIRQLLDIVNYGN